MTLSVVNDIIVAAKAEIQTNLDTEFGAGIFGALDYEYALEGNSFRAVFKKYGFIPQGALFAEGEAGILRRVVMNHDFQMILTHDFKNQDDEVPQSSAVALVYEATNDLLKKLINRKLGLPATVLLVSGTTIDPPEFLNDNSVVALRTNMTVRYRYSTS